MNTKEYLLPMECTRCKSWVIMTVLENGTMWTRCPQCRWTARQE